MQAHDEQQECNIGDTVRIRWCKRISKHKSYNVAEVLQRVPQFDAARARLAALKEMYSKELGSDSMSVPRS
jgi:hypothetical protein